MSPLLMSTFGFILPLVAAWPAAMSKAPRATGRLNTGAGVPDPTFDAELQYVDVSPGTAHEWQAPGDGDTRGVCPGLNAAANHGFLPRNGIVTIEETITGLADAYNMSPDLGNALGVISVLLAGDFLGGTWSIGDAYAAALPLLSFTPSGLDGTHNRYEGDASITRGDAYLNGGNPGVFQNRSWDVLMQIIGDGDDLTLDLSNAHNHYERQYSTANNPYYFSGPFSGVVSAAAYQFTVNFMSNHSEEQPGGTLSKSILRSFFSVEGDDTDFVHRPGYERIPENWYKRPGGSASYSLADVVLDFVAGGTNYGDLIEIGGNTGKVNTFTGIDVGDLTGGVFDAATLLEADNLACFIVRTAEAGAVPLLDGLVESVQGLVTDALQPLNEIAANLSCPQLESYNETVLEGFPGYAS